MSLVASAVAAVPGEEADWRVVRDDIVRVSCTEVIGEPWCRSVGVIAANIDEIDEILTNIERTSHKFQKVRSARKIDLAIRHVTIDYPSILADRDYVARYSRQVTDGRRILSWVPVEHPSAPPVRGVVRLTEFEGEWRLEAMGEYTQVWYVWHADPAGDFPNWALSQAKTRTGYEVLQDLAHASGAALVAPEQAPR